MQHVIFLLSFLPSFLSFCVALRPAPLPVFHFIVNDTAIYKVSQARNIFFLDFLLLHLKNIQNTSPIHLLLYFFSEITLRITEAFMCYGSMILRLTHNTLTKVNAGIINSSAFQLGMIFLPRGHLKMSGCHN